MDSNSNNHKQSQIITNTQTITEFEENIHKRRTNEPIYRQPAQSRQSVKRKP